MRLVACLDGHLAGTVEQRGARVSFSYEPTWLGLDGVYPLSQSLPLQSAPVTGAKVTNFLWGLLPDNQRTLDGWARHFGVSARNPVALLANVGEDCAGAVQFVRPECVADIIHAAQKRLEIDWLTDQELEQRIRRLAQDSSEGRASPEEGQFSLSGAQAKTALYFDPKQNRWGIPRGRTPTTHILKPVTNDFDGFAENEHFCLALVRRLGLPAAHTEWRIIGGIPTLIGQRYDRVYVDGRWHRIHQEDCCQALGVSPESKYENHGGPGFPQIMALLNGSDEPEVDRDRLMQTACFTFLVAATDAHSKNFSLIYARGQQRASLRLAPLYDIASAWPYPQRVHPQKMKLAMRIGRRYKIAEIQPRHFSSLAMACNYSSEKIQLMLRSMAERLPDEAAALQREIEVKSMQHAVLTKLVDGIAHHCKSVLRAM